MSRELADISDALADGLAACVALETWVRTADGRDIVRSRTARLKRGQEALEKLRAQLRDGRRHIEVPDDHYDLPRAANLEKADEGYRLCDTCEGVGTTMIAKMYPTGHAEVTDTCPDCEGEGQVEITAAGAA